MKLAVQPPRPIEPVLTFLDMPTGPVTFTEEPNVYTERPEDYCPYCGVHWVDHREDCNGV